MININFKKTHKDAVIPSYATSGDAGMDLTAVSVKYDSDKDVISYDTGIAVEIPLGYVGLIFPRSSICKKDLSLSNSVGVIDSGYRGTIKANFNVTPVYWEEAEGIKDFQKSLEEGSFCFYRDAEDKHHNDEDGRFAFVAKSYSVGDKICQLMIIPHPQIKFNEVDELSDSERGEGGHGSTGN